MCRERALKVARVLMSLYLTLGIFQLLPSRNPSAHRSLIALPA